MTTKRNIYIFILLVGILIYSCKNDGKKTAAVEAPTARLKVPTINKDSAYAFIKAQVNFGARVPGTPAHTQCGDYLVAQCKAYGADVIEQKFEGQTYTGIKFNARNIIASFNPTLKNRVLLVAHWDTRFESDHDTDRTKIKSPVIGADDGASGAGILLEIARQLKLNPIPSLGIDLFFTDAEDQGSEGNPGADDWCLGTQYWAKNKHKAGYQAKFGILLDMVGARSPRYTKDGTSVSYASNLSDKVWKLAQSMGYGNYFVNDNSSALIDDHLYINKLTGIPTIDLINRPTNESFPAHHHTTNDVLSVIDADALKATGQVVLAVIYREANGEF